MVWFARLLIQLTPPTISIVGGVNQHWMYFPYYNDRMMFSCFLQDFGLSQSIRFRNRIDISIEHDRFPYTS